MAFGKTRTYTRWGELYQSSSAVYCNTERERISALLRTTTCPSLFREVRLFAYELHIVLTEELAPVAFIAVVIEATVVCLVVLTLRFLLKLTEIIVSIVFFPASCGAVG